jgi:hypothetical protein
MHLQCTQDDKTQSNRRDTVQLHVIVVTGTLHLFTSVQA